MAVHAGKFEVVGFECLQLSQGGFDGEPPALDIAKELGKAGFVHGDIVAAEQGRSKWTDSEKEVVARDRSDIFNAESWPICSS
jgi:hypothetical protein